MGDATRHVKTWLLRKTHTLFGSARLDRQLAQIREELRAAQATTRQLHSSTAKAIEAQGQSGQALQAMCRSAEALESLSSELQSATRLSAENNALLQQVAKQLAEMTQAGQNVLQPQPVTPAENIEALRALETQGLFILGAARSGTTILTRSLNRANDILLLEEPDFFDNRHVTEFAAFFNAKHVSMGNRSMKGTYVPPPISPEVGSLGLLERLRRDYRYVGAKTAIGPHPYPTGWQQTWLDFQSKHFHRGRYIYIMRTPVESLWSMCKKFSDRPIAMMFEAWLRATALSLDAYHVFPQSRLVFFDDLSPTAIERLGQWLDVSIPYLPGTFGRSYVNSKLPPGEVPEVLQPYAGLCRECTVLYQELRESFSKDDFVYCGSASEWRYFENKLQQIEDLLTRLHPDAGEADSRLRIAA